MFENMSKRSIIREIVHFIFRVSFKGKCIRYFAKDIKNKKILELGSGKKENGKYAYSVKQFFDDSNEFIQSDIVESYGHKKIDITKMDCKNEFDVVLCLNVLEHVFDFHKAIDRLYQALKPDATAVVFIPVFYPLHDEPNDYWRFTEHAIRKLLKNFSNLTIKHSGMRQYPFAYYIEAKK